MSKKWFAPVAALLLLAAIALWSAREDGPEMGATRRDPAREVAAVAPGEAPQRSRDDAAPDGAQRTAASIPADPTMAARVTLRVVDAATRAPVAGAEVFGPTTPLAFGLDPLESIVWQRQQVERLATTDERGEAVVPAAYPGSVFAVHHGERYGEAVLEDYAMPGVGYLLEVAIAPDRPLTVRAIDANGTPVPGLPIGARVVRASLGRHVCEPRPLGRTDEDGRLVCRARHLLVHALREHPRAAIVPFAPGAWQDGGEPVAFDASPAAEVVVRVPPLGSLRCELRDVDDRVLAGAVTNVRFDDAPGRRGGTLHDPDLARVQWSRQLDGIAAAVWSHCALGRTLVVHFTGEYGSHRGTGAGPFAAGQSATIVVREREGTCVVRGRLLQPDGSPLSRWPIVLRCRAQGRSGLACVRTDAIGGFRFGLDPTLAGLRLDQVLVRPESSDSRLLAAGIFATVPGTYRREVLVALATPRVLVGDEHIDLGALTLAEPPLLCSGRVAATGIEPSRVSLEIEQGIVEGTGTRWHRAPDATVSWHREEDGSFAALAAGLAGPLRLVAHSADAEAIEPVAFAPGRTDVVVAVARAASIRGTIDASGATPHAVDFRVALVDHGGERVLWTDGREFAFRGLREGRYDVRVFAPGDPGPVAEVAGVRVQAGADANDPRLSPIVVGAPLRALQVRVRAPDDEAPDGVILACAQPGGEVAGSFALRSGRATVVTRLGSLDLWVCVRGLPPRHVTATTDDLLVELERPREVLLRHAPDAVPDGYAVVFDLELAVDEPPLRGLGTDVAQEWFGHARRLEFGDDGTCRLPLLTAAPSRIVAAVTRRSGSDHAAHVPLQPATLPTGAEVVDLTWTRADLQAAIARLPDRDH